MINYGALLSKTDLRDYKVKAKGTIEVTEFELDNLPTVKNQSSVSSCVAHSTSSILEWFNRKETNETYKLSTGFIYGMQGVAFNRLDSGMYLRDACKIIQQYGDCSNDTISFNIEMPECYERLSKCLTEDIYKEAFIFKVKSYEKCSKDKDVKYALMQNSPVLISVKWYDKYKFTDGNVINFDKKSDYGNHAVMVYGFNEKGWLCQNSWGKNWGKDGRFILPYEHGFREAWSFIDAENSSVYKPKRNSILDMLYKMLNGTINFFKGLFKKN